METRVDRQKPLESEGHDESGYPSVQDDLPQKSPSNITIEEVREKMRERVHRKITVNLGPGDGLVALWRKAFRWFVELIKTLLYVV